MLFRPTTNRDDAQRRADELNDSEARQWPSAEDRWAHGWCYRVHKFYVSPDGTKDLFGIRWAASDGGEGWL